VKGNTSHTSQPLHSHSRKESDLGKTPIHASFKSDEAQLYNELCDAALNLCGFAPATLF
jgi:hypothetical protein